MRILLGLWAFPLIILGSWYFLSYYDINFGFLILSRDLHDLVFALYGNLLGVPPTTVPYLLWRAILIDTILVFSIIVIRMRYQWFPKTAGRVATLTAKMWQYLRPVRPGNPRFIGPLMAQSASKVPQIQGGQVLPAE